MKIADPGTAATITKLESHVSHQREKANRITQREVTTPEI
jgi:hypothetical protein